jgi:hypothetical protein
MEPFDPGAPAPRGILGDRIRLLQHGGRNIVLQDFSGISDAGEALQVVAVATSFMEKQPRGEALVLTDVSGARLDDRVVEAMKQLAVHHKPWVKKSVIVGMTPILRIVYRVIVAFTRREIHIATTRAEALDWVVREDGPAQAPPR